MFFVKNKALKQQADIPMETEHKQLRMGKLREGKLKLGFHYTKSYHRFLTE